MFWAVDPHNNRGKLLSTTIYYIGFWAEGGKLYWALANLRVHNCIEFGPEAHNYIIYKNKTGALPTGSLASPLNHLKADR